jgi:hypothetical protein
MESFHEETDAYKRVACHEHRMTPRVQEHLETPEEHEDPQDREYNEETAHTTKRRQSALQWQESDRESQ